MNLAEPLAQLRQKGFCLLRSHLPVPLVDACREAFWPTLEAYLKRNAEIPNRGPHRHFLPMPFEPPCFTPEFFFNAEILAVIHENMGTEAVADQWGCDVPLLGSCHQQAHVDYQRPLFSEAPDLLLPAYMLVVSFGLVNIGAAHGPLEIAPGTHCMPREEALRKVRASEISWQPVTLSLGDVLIRHPWTLHRGTPNLTDIPRALASIRYVRRWYKDDSREVNAMPRRIWQALTPQQQNAMRFPLADC